MSFLDKTGLARLWSNILALADTKVPSSRTVNGKPLSNNITLTFSDVEADESGAAATALDTAKSYTDTKIANLASTSLVNTSIGTHNTSTTAHNDIRGLITDLTTKLNNFLDVDDATADQLSEVLILIENNKGTLESLTSTKINVSDIVNDLTTNSTSKVLSAAQGVAIKSLIDALDTAIDGKADSTHNHSASNITSGTMSVDRLPSGTTSAKGIVQLTNSTSSTSTTTAATPSSVKSAYDLANTAKTNAATAQTRADNAYTLASGKADASALNNYYTKTEIDGLQLISISDIDTICGSSIQVATASEVTF